MDYPAAAAEQQQQQPTGAQAVAVQNQCPSSSATSDDACICPQGLAKQVELGGGRGGGGNHPTRCQCSCGCLKLRIWQPGQWQCLTCGARVCGACRGEGSSEAVCHCCSWGGVLAAASVAAESTGMSASAGEEFGLAAETSECGVSDEQYRRLCCWCKEHVTEQLCISCTRPLCGRCIGDRGRCGVCDPWFGQDPSSILHGRAGSSQSSRNVFHLMKNQQHNPEQHTHCLPCMACGLWMGEHGLRCTLCCWHVHARCMVGCMDCGAHVCTRDWLLHICPGSDGQRDLPQQHKA